MKTSEALQKLLKHVPRKSAGICSNFVRVSDRSSDVLNEGMVSWPDLIGSKINPVEGNFEDYLNNERKWDRRTKMGKRRFDLLNHLIKFYEEIGD